MLAHSIAAESKNPWVLVVVGFGFLILVAMTFVLPKDSPLARALRFFYTDYGAWSGPIGFTVGRSLATVAGVVLIVLGGVFLTGANTPTSNEVVGSSSNLLPASAAVPTGVSPSVFAPSGLGVSVTLPASWQRAPARSGFQYVMTSRQPPAFLLATRANGNTTPPSAARSAANRRTLLQHLGATVASASAGIIDGHSAFTLRYTLPGAGSPISDIEYDIIIPGPLLVSVSPTQTSYDTMVTTYNDVVIVLGTPSTSHDPPLTNWIASTIRVTA